MDITLLNVDISVLPGAEALKQFQNLKVQAASLGLTDPPLIEFTYSIGMTSKVAECELTNQALNSEDAKSSKD